MAVAAGGSGDRDYRFEDDYGPRSCGVDSQGLRSGQEGGRAKGEQGGAAAGGGWKLIGCREACSRAHFERVRPRLCAGVHLSAKGTDAGGSRETRCVPPPSALSRQLLTTPSTPGTEYENVRFRSAILSTIPVLRTPFPSLPSPPLTPTPGTVLLPFLPSTPHSPRAAPLSPLAPLLALKPSPLPEALTPLAELYEQYLVRAAYDKVEPREEDWDNVVKIVAVFVGVLGAANTATGV